MGYFPFFIDIKNKLIIIVGGGRVAYGKIEKLLPFEPYIVVISPEICDEIRKIENIRTIERKFSDSDIDGAFAVIGATNDEELNGRISRLCREKNILVNIVDDKEKCGFIFPAIARKNDITIGITTSGKSPLLAGYLRCLAENMIDEGDFQKTAEILGRYRSFIKDKLNSKEQKKYAFERIIREKMTTDWEIGEMLEQLNMTGKIRIGTRRSKLAFVQTRMVEEQIHKLFPNIETEIVTISTRGDKITDKPLSQLGGKGVFVSEIEKALQEREIDIAVHSGKDLPVKLGEGLEITGVLKRGSCSDVLVTVAGRSFEKADKFIVGTGSMRRRINLKRLYPNAVFEDIRGNADTRLRKLQDGEYDGIVLAMAALERLCLYKAEQFSFREFDYSEFIPAPCQGIIAVQGRKNDEFTPVIRCISDKNTFYCFETERYILQLLNGDCTIPIGAYAFIDGNKIILTFSRDGEKIVRGESEISNRLRLAEELTRIYE